MAFSYYQKHKNTSSITVLIINFMFIFLQLLHFLYIINVIISVEVFIMAILNLGATGHAFKDETFEKVANNLKSNNIAIKLVTIIVVIIRT